jgi:hypothetical protein
MRGKGSLADWIRILWQRHGLRPEEFYAMPTELQAWYVAMELREQENPCRDKFS